MRLATLSGLCVALVLGSACQVEDGGETDPMGAGGKADSQGSDGDEEAPPSCEEMNGWCDGAISISCLGLWDGHAVECCAADPTSSFCSLLGAGCVEAQDLTAEARTACCAEDASHSYCTPAPDCAQIEKGFLECGLSIPAHCFNQEQGEVCCAADPTLAFCSNLGAGCADIMPGADPKADKHCECAEVAEIVKECPSDCIPHDEITACCDFGVEHFNCTIE